METVLLFILGVVIIVIGLALSIGLHEIGHLVPAKKFGVKVGQYMIGFGPTLWKRKYGETEYGVKAMPLGGYISMAGHVPARQEGRQAAHGIHRLLRHARAGCAHLVGRHDQGRATRIASSTSSPIWKRIIIMLGGPTMNLLIAIVLYAVVLCGFGAAAGLAHRRLASSECIVPATSERSRVHADRRPGSRRGRRLLAGRPLRQHRRHRDRQLDRCDRDHPRVARRAARPSSSTATAPSQTLELTPMLTERDRRRQPRASGAPTRAATR